ncbi:hypothetical protein RQP46_002008 [Phenoliferia psychrophenolica]
MKVRQYSRELFCLSDADLGEFGWTPFCMVDSVLSGTSEQILTAEVISPEFERFDPAEPTETYLFIQHTVSLVSIRESYWDDQQFGKDTCHSRRHLTWDNELAGRLVRATPKLLERRFTCPECDGSREVEVGTIEVEKRWPLLTTPFQRPLLCPRCQVPYDYAVDMMECEDRNIEEMLAEEEALAFEI